MTAPRSIDALDRAIIRATQAGLPLVVDPYGAVARKVGTSSADVAARMRSMLAAGTTALVPYLTVPDWARARENTTRARAHTHTRTLRRARIHTHTHTDTH